MKLEEQVTNLELSKKLKELGVKQKSLFTWVKGTETQAYKLMSFEEPWYGAVSHYYSAGFDSKEHPMFSAFTVAELGEILPQHKVVKRKYNTFWIAVPEGGFSTDKTQANACAKMLIYSLENKLL